MAHLHIPADHISIQTGGSGAFTPHVFANEREDGTWEGWIEFHPEGDGPFLVTGRETTQPNRTAMEYWAEGLEPVYFEGAFRRAAELTLLRSSDYRRPASRLSRKY